MPASGNPNCRLVADIGGTNARLALYDPTSNSFRASRNYINREYATFQDVVSDWMGKLPEAAPGNCCLAIAAPPFDDVVNMFNMDWSFSLQALREQFRFANLRCLNDFEANAYSLQYMGLDDLVTLHAGAPGSSGTLATVGPGTGLGGSTLRLVEGIPVASVCEPGHMGLAPATQLELALFGALLPSFGEVHAELLLSGPGIPRLYHCLGEILGLNSEALTPEEITARALRGDCDLCVATLDTFCGLLGSICGDFVLAHGAYGGLYLTGGILPNIIPVLQASTFVTRFRSKGNMQDYLAAVPLHIIVSGRAGLVGAAHAPL